MAPAPAGVADPVPDATAAALRHALTQLHTSEAGCGPVEDPSCAWCRVVRDATAVGAGQALLDQLTTLEQRVETLTELRLALEARDTAQQARVNAARELIKLYAARGVRSADATERALARTVLL